MRLSHWAVLAITQLTISGVETPSQPAPTSPLSPAWAASASATKATMVIRSFFTVIALSLSLRQQADALGDDLVDHALGQHRRHQVPYWIGRDLVAHFRLRQGQRLVYHLGDLFRRQTDRVEMLHIGHDFLHRRKVRRVPAFRHVEFLLALAPDWGLNRSRRNNDDIDAEQH